jgi:uncharacterized repeat protein (TIGR02543 family)
MKAARPAVFFLCAVLLTPAGCRVDGPDHGGIDPLGPGYTVTFEGNGGIPATQTRTVTRGSLLDSLPEKPTREKYEFDHWNTFPNGKGKAFTRKIPVKAHTEVYAKWLTNPYWVIFDAAGGSVSPQSQAVERGTPFNGDLLPTPEKERNTFDGWYTAGKGGGTEFTAGALVTADITVYAKWLATVTFNTDGGSAAPQPVTVTSGTTLSSLPIPTRNAWDTFGGWYTAVDGGGEEFTNTTPVTADITVYAWWIHTVTFNTDGGSVSPASVTVTSGTTLGSSKMPSDPTKEKYRFGGWYTEQNGGGAEFKADTPVTADRMVYAKWTIDADSLPAVIDWINSNAVERGSYTYTLTRNETVTSGIMFNQKRVNITLEGDSTERIVDFSNTAGDLFAVDKDVTLTLGNNLTLRGRDNSPKSLIVVCNEGHLVMNAGSKICDNKFSGNGGGIYLVGTFTMNGGEIRGNTGSSGGGVFSLRPFTMNGGTISGNTATSNGGGVFAYSNGPPTIRGGTISNNIPNDIAP